MSRTSFNSGWTVGPKTNLFAELQSAREEVAVTLPHDALLDEPRSPGGDSRTGYFREGLAVTYTRSFDVPEDWRNKHIAVEFQAAYRDAMVFVNDEYAAQRPFGYSTFVVVLDDLVTYGAQNTIRVDVRGYQDTRWYSGVGLLRDVVLLVCGEVHVAHEGPAVTTPDIDDERAVVAVNIPVTNSGRGTATATVETHVIDAAGAVVAQDSSPITLRGGETGNARHRVFLPAPHRWSVDDPYLYSTEVIVRLEDTETDRTTVPLGIRRLRLDPQHGLRINDVSVKLRGACIHHDNGVLGAATIGRAEERRIELLKNAGFNAIRSAHNPVSQAMLDACDRLGMLVMDETFDVWTEGKTSFDYSLDFPEWWERDVEAMVLKDRNHPSVIFYSIGNEIVETGSPIGSIWGRKLAEKVRALDDTRLLTNGVNAFVALIRDVAAQMRAASESAGPDTTESVPEGGVNALMSQAENGMNRIAASSTASERTAEAFSQVDVAGLNYGDSRYELEPSLFPNRVVVGTETFPLHIDVNWRLVEENPHVIGDFTWTGWDYLGEAGIGRLHYADTAPAGLEGAYPWLTAWCGDHDITGHRRPASYYREVVLGLRHTPYIAVERPQNFGRDALVGGWGWTDSLASWTWAVAPGSPVRCEVYSDADEVELLVNGRSLGRQPAGREHGFRARFELEYEPGELVAVAYEEEAEQSRAILRTAHDDVELTVVPDRERLVASHADLSFVTIELRDGAGVLVNDADRFVAVEVAGAGRLQGLGTGRPSTEERFDTNTCTTFDGRALAVVRPTGEGQITVTVKSEGSPPVTRTLSVTEAPR